MGNGIRNRLQENGVRAESYFPEDYACNLDFQRAFALLGLLRNPRDKVLLRFLFGWPGNDNWQRDSWAIVRRICEANGAHPWDLLLRLSQNPGQRNEEEDVPNSCIRRFNAIRDDLNRFGAIDDQALLDELFPPNTAWTSTIRSRYVNPEGIIQTWDEVFNLISNDLKQPQLPREFDGVRIMSLQGLTASLVVVVGCVKGAIPYWQSDWSIAEMEQGRKEGRRLFYVAITRATETLVLSSFSSCTAGINPRNEGLVARGRITQTTDYWNELGPACPRAITGDDFIRDIFGG